MVTVPAIGFQEAFLSTNTRFRRAPIWQKRGYEFSTWHTNEVLG